MDFDINGFLGTEINTFITDNYNTNNEMFLLCEEMNRFFINTRNKIKVNGNDVKGVIICLLAIKIHNACQSVVILSKYGLDIEAQAIARTALESLFYLSAIIKRDDFYKEFIDSDIIHKRKLAKRIDLNPDSFSSLKDNRTIQEFIKHTNNGQADRIKDYKLWEIVDLAEMKDDYNYVYTVLCDSVHPNIYNLENRYIVETDEDTNTFAIGPSVDGIDRTLFTVCYIFIRTLDCMNDYFKLRVKTALTKLERKTKKVCNK